MPSIKMSVKGNPKLNDMGKLAEKIASKVAEELKKETDTRLENVIVDSYLNEYGKAFEVREKGGTVSSFVDGNKAEVRVSGDKITFVEFGSGVHYNGNAGSSPHPKGFENGMLIGEYGKKHGRKDNWIVTSEGNEVVRSQGVPMQSPMWNATQAVRKNLKEIVKESLK